MQILPRNDHELYRTYKLKDIEQRLGKVLADEFLFQLIKSNGKLWRPKLLLLMAEASGCTDDHILNLAVAVELLHLATIIHDDVIDESTIRRGHKSLASEYGKGIAVLAGDNLFAKSYDMIIQSGNIKIIKLANQTILQMSRIELEQEMHKWDHTITEDIYIRRCINKTSSLFILAARVGAMAGNFSPVMVEIAGKFGEILGLAYQIYDDLMDFCGDATVMGKARGNDFSRGVLTLPVIYAIHKYGVSSLAKWWRNSSIQKDMEELNTYLYNIGAFEYVQTKILTLLEQARKLIPYFSSRISSRLHDFIGQISKSVKEVDQARLNHDLRD